MGWFGALPTCCDRIKPNVQAAWPSWYLRNPKTTGRRCCGSPNNSARKDSLSGASSLVRFDLRRKGYGWMPTGMSNPLTSSTAFMNCSTS